MIENKLIESVKINDAVYKLGFEAYVDYDFITRISNIQAFVKNNVVVVNIYHRMDSIFNKKGELVGVKGQQEYLFKTIVNPRKLEIKYKMTGLYEEQSKFLEEPPIAIS